MISETDLTLQDGCALRVYDTGTSGVDGELTVFWHHGTPNLGLPPEPLFRPGVRWVAYDRPGYGGSSPNPDRDVASAALYTATIADALGLGRFAVVGHSGGGPHALACAALLPGRVLSAVSVAGLAPFGAAGLEYFAGMTPVGEASLRAAVAGRAAKARYEANPQNDPEMFTPADHRALAGAWSWFGKVVGPATANGPGGLIDDDLAYALPWGFDPAEIAVPVMLMHGERDRVVPASHSRWLAEHVPTAELRLYPDEGHISVLSHAEAALGWLREQRKTP